MEMSSRGHDKSGTSIFRSFLGKKYEEQHAVTIDGNNGSTNEMILLHCCIFLFFAKLPKISEDLDVKNFLSISSHLHIYRFQLLIFLQKFLTENSEFLFLFRCRASEDCDGFLVNYESEACFKVETNSADKRADIKPTYDGKVNYFQKVCLRGTVQKVTQIFLREVSHIFRN